MRKILIFLILICLLPTRSFANVEFFALLPNPAGDDTLGEYIEIRNTGCQVVDIGGYRLYDAVNKTYIIPSGTTIGSHENISFLYRDTKISLNNSGIETITLATSTGMIIDTENYSATQKDNIVISLSPVDEDCSFIVVENSTGSTNTNTNSTGSQDSSSTGGTTEMEGTNTGTAEQNLPDPISQEGTGTTSTGYGVPQDDGSTSTGTTNTGSTDSGTTDSVPTNTGVINEIIFPEIFSTRQEPTNATLSGNIWDCGVSQPCRVNVIFDPIFTGELPAKNYICEVITATGTLTTCNPNTLYFSTDSDFSFRLTSKLDPSQSMSVTWGVRFTAPSLIDSENGNQTPLSPPLTGGLDTTNTGVIDSSNTNTGLTSSGVIFPEIAPTFQNYTNTTNSGDTLTCVTSPCRVNFTLDPIFTGSFLAKNYTCEIHYGTGVYDSCNPPQLYPIGTGAIEIIVTHKTSGQKETKTLTLIQGTPSTLLAAHTIEKDTTKPVAIIDFDGKMKSYYEQVGDYEFNCYAMTCSVNLTAERSYDPDGGSVRYLWIYSQNEVKTTKDPGAQKYTIGDHTIVFRVIDSSGNYDEIRYIIHVLGPKTEEEKIKTKKVKDPSLMKTKESSKKKKKKLIEMYPREKKMDFFDPPIVTLQDSKFVEVDDRYICRTTTKTCSLNLTLSGAKKGITYTWTYDDGDIITSKNPRSKSFSPGRHEITVSASYSGSTDILWTEILSVKVEKIIKPKKAKKPKKPKVAKTEKSPTLSLIPTAYAGGVPIDDDVRGDMSSFLVFVMLISMTIWYQRRTYLSKKREQQANTGLS